MELNDCLISVIIPMYNRADVISASLKSVLEQDAVNIEVIVVDDGSSDDAVALLAGYPDERVTYLRYEPNRGACYARNYGAERSRGALIAFQDSDDLWHPDKLRRQLEFMRSSGVDFVFCGMNRVSDKGAKYYYPVHAFDPDADALHQLLMENRVGTQTMLMRREVWESTRFDESFRRYQDWDFALRVAARYSMAYLPQALVESAVSTGSISASVNSYPALVHLYEAHRTEFDSRPDCLARLYRRMARRLQSDRPAQAAGYYRSCFELLRKPADLIAWLLCATYSRFHRE